MGRILLFLFLILLCGSVSAQSDISEARNQLIGATVTVSGIVTNGSELGSIRYMQDGTAGIAVYDTQLEDVQEGDSISVTGVLDDYNNLLEIKNVSGFTVHSTGNTLPDLKIVTVDEIGEAYESQLIKVENIQIEGSSGTFSGDSNYDFTDGTNSSEMRIYRDSPIVGEIIPGGEFSLVAICSQYNSTYQLLPRTMDDLILGGGISITSSVEVFDITTTSFTLGWRSNSGGTPYVRYGSSNNESSLTNIKQGDSTSSDEYVWHVADITGLQPAEIIYAQAFLVAGSDTSFSSIGAYATASNSAGEMHVYFNTKVDESLADETTAINLGQYMEDTLAAYINRAEESIDMAVYNFNNSVISDALNAAYDRGVTIRFITCGSTAHAGVDDLNAGISVLERPDVTDGGIMHNKFAAIDAQSADADKAWVWTGSTNLTSTNLYSDANNMVFIQDQSLAKSYQIEFEEMWGSVGDTPNASKANFGADKTDNTPHIFSVGGKTVEMYFSPSDNTNQRLIDAMETADHDLYVETMLITRSDLSGAILDAYDRGANVHVLTNAESDNASYVNEALFAELPANKFVFDDQQAGTLHHKLAIIDTYDKESDPQVITGSHNWSNSANEINDENTVIIHDADIANQYLQQFAYRFDKNGGDLVVSALILQIPDTKVYPNPSSGTLHLESGVPLKSVELFSLSGEKISEWQFSSVFESTLQLPTKLSGIYLLKVVDEDGASNTYKIVKQ